MALTVSESTKEGSIFDFKKLTFKKKNQILIVVILIAVMVVIYFSTFQSPSDQQEVQIASAEGEELTRQMEEILSTIKGAGTVRVLISYQSGPELIAATSQDSETVSNSTGENGGSESIKTKTDVVTVKNNGEEEALVLKEIRPEIAGVLVTATGAEDITVKMNILQAVQTLLNIPANKVDVFTGKIN